MVKTFVSSVSWWFVSSSGGFHMTRFVPILSRGVAHPPDAAVLDVRGLSVHYQQRSVLHNITFRLVHSERIALVGPNGAGKTTLLKAIAGLMNPSAGTIDVYGHQPGGHICIAYVPQRNQIDWAFPVNVFDVVMMGRTRRIGLLRWPRRRDREHVRACLDQVGMADAAARQIGELSGGQQQRVFIARALAQEAELMLMDEPLTGLDAPAQTDIFRTLETLRAQHVTVMVSTHDLNQAAEQFDRVMLLKRELLGIGSASDVFTLDALQHAYGSQMRVVGGGGSDGSNSSGGDAPLAVMVDSCCEDAARDAEPQHSHSS